MAMLPKLKIKALVSFPANVFGGTGISIDKANGNFTIDLNYSEFAFQGTLPTGSNVLVWDPVSNVYTLIPPSATGGISDAPTDGNVYGRKSAAWVDAWASPVLTGNPTAPTPSPGDNDTSVATTAFVAAAMASAGTPATLTPLVESGLGAVGTSLKYAREDHVHPAGGGGGGGASVLVSDTAPTGATVNSLWFESDTGILYIYYADGTSTQWVAIAAGGIDVGAVRFDSAQTLTTTQQARARTNIAVPNANVVINGDFRINQGGYVSGAVLAAGLYGHDQWKAGAGGGDYSFTQLKSSTQITIAAGKSLIQPIEDVNVAGGSYILSWTGTAQARAGVNTLTPSGSYAASPLLITGQTAGTVMSVEFNAGTLGTVKLEVGSTATPLIMRPYDQELLTCQRYWQKSAQANTGSVLLFSGNVTSGGVYFANTTFRVIMRATPTIMTFTPIAVSAFPSAAPNAFSAAPEGVYVNAIASITGGGYFLYSYTADARL